MRSAYGATRHPCFAELDVARTVVVVGHASQQVMTTVQQQAPEWAHVSFVEQAVQRGTGDATIVGLGAMNSRNMISEIDDTSTIVVMPGDTPLLRQSTISALVAEHESSGNAATLLTAFMDDPTGYGRIVRTKDDHITKVTEERDASPEIRLINEVNTSIYAFRRDLLGLTAESPIIPSRRLPHRRRKGWPAWDIGSDAHTAQGEVVGVNDRWQLAVAERELRSRTTDWLLPVSPHRPATDFYRCHGNDRARCHSLPVPSCKV